MKNIFAFIALHLFFALFSAPWCAAQWTVSYQDPNANFVDAAFPTDLIGYVATNDSGGACVLRTHDGGLTWNKRSIPGWSFVNKIAMIDSSVGYMIKGGAPVQILKTTDGFQTYLAHDLDSSFAVEALSLLIDSTGLYLNNAARLRIFKQNGAVFSHLIDTLNYAQSLQMVTSQDGYMDTGTELLATADGGHTWTTRNNNLGFNCVMFRFSNATKGFFSDFTHIYKTNNGGLTFVQPYSFPNVYNIATSGNVLALAANDTGNVALTTDGGFTWQQESTGIAWIANEPYKVVMTPGGDCFIYCEICGEIRKRTSALNAVAPPQGAAMVSAIPNPFSAETYLSFEQAQESAEIAIMDVLGQTVRTMNFSGKSLRFERGNLPAGIYFVRVSKADGTIALLKIVAQ